ncbi:MAG: SHOCT domain-containing protein, partial [Atopobiaceae bacterium]|nr:SHOCT domain-containing protein [Atopobiaceae bacterium]
VVIGPDDAPAPMPEAVPVPIAVPVAMSVPEAMPAAGDDPYEELKKLKELLDLGIITREEFERKKASLLW